MKVPFFYKNEISSNFIEYSFWWKILGFSDEYLIGKCIFVEEWTKDNFDSFPHNEFLLSEIYDFRKSWISEMIMEN